MSICVNRARLEALFSELGALGYAESDFEEHYEGLSVDDTRPIARAVVRRAPNVIVAFSNVDVVAPKEATSHVPIVM